MGDADGSSEASDAAQASEVQVCFGTGVTCSVAWVLESWPRDNGNDACMRVCGVLRR